MTDEPTRILVPSVKFSGANILANHFLGSYPMATIKNQENGLISDHVYYTKADLLWIWRRRKAP